MKVSAKQVIEIEISPQEFVNELRKKFGVIDFKIVDNEIYHYERVTWDDYDYVKFKGDDDRCSEIKENLEIIANLVQKLNKYRNPYVEELFV